MFLLRKEQYSSPFVLVNRNFNNWKSEINNHFCCNCPGYGGAAAQININKIKRNKRNGRRLGKVVDGEVAEGLKDAWPPDFSVLIWCRNWRGIETPELIPFSPEVKRVEDHKLLAWVAKWCARIARIGPPKMLPAKPKLIFVARYPKWHPDAWSILTGANSRYPILSCTTSLRLKVQSYCRTHVNKVMPPPVH